MMPTMRSTSSRITSRRLTGSSRLRTIVDSIESAGGDAGSRVLAPCRVPRNAPMASLDRPRLRPLSFSRHEHGGAEFIALEDSLGVVPAPVLVPWTGFQRVVRHFDGTASLAEIQARILRETARQVPMAELRDLVERLDRAMV